VTVVKNNSVISVLLIIKLNLEITYFVENVIQIYIKNIFVMTVIIIIKEVYLVKDVITQYVYIVTI
jgi:hypothetical protein